MRDSTSWYRFGIGLLCLYIVEKVEIWSVVTFSNVARVTSIAQLITAGSLVVKVVQGAMEFFCERESDQLLENS